MSGAASSTIQGDQPASAAFAVAVPGPQGAVGNAGAHTFAAIQAVPSGGSSPYTHSWSFTSDNGGTWSDTGANTDTVTPRVYVGIGGGSTATFRDTVVDNASNTVVSSGVICTYVNTSLL